MWEEGASLALTYHSQKEAVDALVKELSESNSNDRLVTIHKVDTSSVKAIEGIIVDIKEQHKQDAPDILVSNAGYGKRLPGILDVTYDEFDFTIDVNLKASFVLSKLCIPHMEAQNWGRIVFVSSIAAIGGGINACH